MKKNIFLFGTLFFVTASFAQTPAPKLALNKGQKINGDITLTVESSTMGMDMSNNSISRVDFDVKEVTATTTTITTTLRKLKVDSDMGIMGKSKYDSDKPEDNTSELAKMLGSAMNVPADTKIDNTTGKATDPKPASPEKEDPNPMAGLAQQFGGTSTSGAEDIILLIPQGKKEGDSWSDSLVSKGNKTVNTFTLNSIKGSEAVVHINVTSTNSADIDSPQGKITMNTTATSTGDITSDVKTGLVKQRKTVTNTEGTMEAMGQELPVTAKTTLTATYQ